MIELCVILIKTVTKLVINFPLCHFQAIKTSLIIPIIFFLRKSTPNKIEHINNLRYNLAINATGSSILNKFSIYKTFK